MTGVPPWINTPGTGLEPSVGFVRAQRKPEQAALAYPPDMEWGLPNCGLLALAIASNMPLAHVKHWFKNHGKLDGSGYRDNWKGYTHPRRYGAYLKSRWVNHTHVKLDKPCAITRFAYSIMRPGVTYVLDTRGHALTLKDGWLCDQYDLCKVEHHKRKGKRVIAYWEVRI